MPRSRSRTSRPPTAPASCSEGIADRSESSAPLVQLAGLELDLGRIDEAAAVVDKIRARWKDSATVNILDAQLALRRGKIDEAIEHFNAALRKDPGNKIVQYWKAKLDSSAGSVVEATRALEGIVRDKPVKEVEAGTTLQSAAESALAGLSLQARDFDDAIRRFEELKRSSGTGTLSRGDRWKLITAYINKNQWPQAKRRDRRDPQRHQVAALVRRAGPRRQLLSPAGRERRGAGADRLRAEGRARPIPRRSSRGRTSCSRRSSPRSPPRSSARPSSRRPGTARGTRRPSST